MLINLQSTPAFEYHHTNIVKKHAKCTTDSVKKKMRGKKSMHQVTFGGNTKNFPSQKFKYIRFFWGGGAEKCILHFLIDHRLSFSGMIVDVDFSNLKIS